MQPSDLAGEASPEEVESRRCRDRRDQGEQVTLHTMNIAQATPIPSNFRDVMFYITCEAVTHADYLA